MTRAELISNILKIYPSLSPALAGAMVSKIFDVIIGKLAEGHRIEIRGFGTFAVRHRPPRIGRNPKTGVRVPIGPVKVVSFHTGKQLKTWINEDI
ncbi:MAG: integration host factor subunit beta [Holosporales bacterium]|jgi:integration host factor subunit beta|nr:integration host factor subunit beta [Holosporales bacterium]